MKRRLRIYLVAVIAIGVAYGALYEYFTHVGRGWVFGEAHYQGRPTSYWRVHCDDWLDRFDTPEDAARWYPTGIGVPIRAIDPPGSECLGPRRRPATFWTRIMDRFRTLDDIGQERWPPDVLWGYPGSEPVLAELAQDERYRLVTERSLQFAEVYRKIGTGPDQ
jgi:hypothetical protein